MVYFRNIVANPKYLHKQDKEANIFSIFNKSKFFFFVAFINSFMPIFLCIISSFIKPYGAQEVMGVGYVSAFLLTFSQVGISFATTTFFIIKNKIKKNNISNNKHSINEVMAHSIMMSLIMGVVLMVVYIISSYLYMTFMCDRPNTLQTLEYGLEFIWSSIGFILFICLNFLLILYIKLLNQRLAWFLQLFSTILIILLAYLFGVRTNLGATGIGLGCTIGSIITLFITASIIYIKYPIKMKSIKFIKYSINNIKDIFRESLAGITVSFFKGIAILILALAMPVQIKDFVPLSYQMSRLIWFNLMYALVWFSTGVSDSIKFFNLSSNDDTCPMLRIKWFNKMIILSVCITIYFCIFSWFMVEPLAHLYTQNSTWDVSLETIKPIWGNKEWGGTNINPNGNLTPKWFLDMLLINPEFKILFLDIGGNKEIMGWALKYISYTTYDPKIITGLLNYDFFPKDHTPIEQIKFYFAFEGYNSKSTIYIFIYSVLCSCWTILLPASNNITKRNVKGYIIIMVYAAALAFLIGFGINYSLLDTNVNNLFRFLDSFTFPLMLIAITVWTYITIKWIVIINIYKRKCHCPKNNDSPFRYTIYRF